MKRPGYILSLILLLIVFPSPASAQHLYGYLFSTGTDSTKWIPLTNPTPLLDGNSTQHTSNVIGVHLLFSFMDERVNSFAVHRSGRMLLNGAIHPDTYSPIRMSQWNYYKYIMPYGVMGDWDTSSSIVYQYVDNGGPRVLVCEFSMKASSTSTSLTRYQIQLHEYNNAIRLVYAPRDGNEATPVGQIGLAWNSSKYISIRSEYHSAAANGDYPPYGLPGPGDYRYYEFTPAPYLYQNCSLIPFTDLYNTDVAVCRIGSFITPDNSAQIIDYGANSRASRHTVHSDTSERDPRTGGRLRTVPLGQCSSVRLGNWDSGAQQESITYILHVDTNDYDLLTLRYALVEQNPGHPSVSQPYFTFSINDSADNLIDHCLWGSFISADMSGWNQGDTTESVLWRDWSSVGVGLAQFHGQEIHVKVSNSDCRPGNHYGYAYIALEGSFKHLTSSSCGNNGQNTFHAPPGFIYNWYSTSHPDSLLSTDDSLTVTEPGTYGCHLYYKLQGRNCGFTMTAHHGARYPVAQFTSLNLDSCGSLRRFVNQSVVATDSTHSQLSTEPCEQYLWRFDDGTTDTNDNPIHSFTAGHHTVTLVAMLAGGQCRDSVSQTFTVDIPSDTMRTTVCPGTTVSFLDEFLTDSGTFTFVKQCAQHVAMISYYPSPSETIEYRAICDGDSIVFGGSVYTSRGRYLTDTIYTPEGCPVTRYLDLTVHPTYSSALMDTIEAGHLFAFADTLLTTPGVHAIHLQTQHGCDSLWRIYLSCLRTIDTTVCVTAMPLTWNGHLFTKAETIHTSYRATAGTDSLVEHTVYVRPKAPAHPMIRIGCFPQPHYILSLPAGYRYQWHSTPADAAFSETANDSLWQLWLAPSSQVRYTFTTDYPDAPSCPGSDSVTLSPSGFFNLNMKVTPEELSPDHLLLTATEIGKSVLTRRWYIDSVLYAEDSKSITYEASPKADSVLVTLIGGNGDCADTLSHVVPVRRHDIFFPNAFTPGLDINNLFLAKGDEITGFGLWVYDRKGILVFHTTDIQEGWDGTTNGTPCKQAAYTYACRFRVRDSGWNTIAGTVLLIR